MGVKVKGGMYCPACKQPVAAVKTSHPLRNTVGLPLTLGLSGKPERWLCPNCGGDAYRRGTAPMSVGEADRLETNSALVLLAAVVLAFVVGVASTGTAGVATFFIALIVGAIYVGVRGA